MFKTYQPASLLYRRPLQYVTTHISHRESIKPCEINRFSPKTEFLIDSKTTSVMQLGGSFLSMMVAK